MLQIKNVYKEMTEISDYKVSQSQIDEIADTLIESGFKNRGEQYRKVAIHSRELVVDKIVKESLEAAALYEEVKDRLNTSALGLSGGQQQRLCIARALAVQPEVILLDEPTSALDPISTLKIEELLLELKKKYTIAIVTHNMQQASRIADYTAFFLVGEMVEYGETKDVFSMPKDKRTEDYITGRFG